MQILTALIPSVVTVCASFYINRKNSKFNSELDKQIAIFKDELEKKNTELKSELSKQEARFKNELDKQKKIAEIYYEERARVLQELFILLVNRPSNIINLLKFFRDSAMGGKVTNPQVYYDLYEELEINEDRLRKALLNSSLYLADVDYMAIKRVRDYWGEPVSLIVDLYDSYKKIPNVNDDSSIYSAEFLEFKLKTLEIRDINNVIKEYTKASVDTQKIADIIKKTIASDDML